MYSLDYCLSELDSHKLVC